MNNKISFLIGIILFMQCTAIFAETAACDAPWTSTTYNKRPNPNYLPWADCNAGNSQKQLADVDSSQNPNCTATPGVVNCSLWKYDGSADDAEVYICTKSPQDCAVYPYHSAIKNLK